MPPTTRAQVDAQQGTCTMLTRQGTLCGKPGHPELPMGICAQHAITVYRAVSSLMP